MERVAYIQRLSATELEERRKSFEERLRTGSYSNDWDIEFDAWNRRCYRRTGDPVSISIRKSETKFSISFRREVFFVNYKYPWHVFVKVGKWSSTTTFVRRANGRLDAVMQYCPNSWCTNDPVIGMIQVDAAYDHELRGYLVEWLGLDPTISYEELWTNLQGQHYMALSSEDLKCNRLFPHWVYRYNNVVDLINFLAKTRRKSWAPQIKRTVGNVIRSTDSYDMETTTSLLKWLLLFFKNNPNLFEKVASYVFADNGRYAYLPFESTDVKIRRAVVTHVNQKRLANLMMSPQSITNLSTLVDCFKMRESIIENKMIEQDPLPTILSGFNKIRRVHEDLVRITTNFESNGDQEIKPAFKAFSVNDMEIMPATSLGQVRSWGQVMHHCIANYATEAAQGRTVLFGIYRGGELVANGQFERKHLVQIRGFGNQDFPEEEVIKEALKEKGLINR